MILITSEEKRDADAYSNMLYHAGIVSYTAEALPQSTEIIYGTRAILVLANNRSQVARTAPLDCEGHALPVFSLFGERIFFEELSVLHSKNESAAALIDKISEILNTRFMKGIGEYSREGINADASLNEVLVEGGKISLTKVEKMILRAIIAASPRPLSANDILSLCFRSGREPLPSSIRTHIAKINAKFKNLCSDFRITSLNGGYHLT